MTLIVEDGSIVADADSFISLSRGRELASRFGLTISPDDDTANIELIQGAMYVNAQESRMSGDRVSAEQTMCYPRSYVYKYGFLIPDNSIPNELEKAQIYAAAEIHANGSPWSTNNGQVVASESVSGAVATTYFNTGSSGSSYTIDAVDVILRPLLGGNGLASFSVTRG